MDNTPELGDGALRGIHRVAMCEPDKAWPASVVEQLSAELIRLRGTDKIWIAQHPQITSITTDKDDGQTDTTI